MERQEAVAVAQHLRRQHHEGMTEAAVRLQVKQPQAQLQEVPQLPPHVTEATRPKAHLAMLSCSLASLAEGRARWQQKWDQMSLAP